MNQNHPPERANMQDNAALLRGHAPDVAPDVARDIERREQLRAEELTRLDELRDRVQRGLDEGKIDPLGGATMLLNISKARMALAGVGVYPS